MPRARKIDPEAALLNAMQLFWREGFEAVGTRQIEDETGITRFTLQQAHGGKKALFLQALDTYLDLFDAHAAPPGHARTPEDIVTWFRSRTAPPMMPEAAVNGCLMLNTIAEFGARDPEITQRTERYFALLHDRFRSALHGLRAAGTLSEKTDIAKLAETLTACAIAMNVTIRARGTNEAGAPMVQAVADLLCRD